MSQKKTIITSEGLVGTTFTAINDAFVAGVSDPTAAWLLSYLIRKREYFLKTKKLKDGDRFFLTSDQIQEEMNISKKTRIRVTKILIAEGLLVSESNGVPTKTYYDIQDDAVSKLLTDYEVTRSQRATRAEKGTRSQKATRGQNGTHGFPKGDASAFPNRSSNDTEVKDTEVKDTSKNNYNKTIINTINYKGDAESYKNEDLIKVEVENQEQKAALKTEESSPGYYQQWYFDKFMSSTKTEFIDLLLKHIPYPSSDKKNFLENELPAYTVDELAKILMESGGNFFSPVKSKAIAKKALTLLREE